MLVVQPSVTMIESVKQLPPPTAFSRLPRHVKHPRVSLPVQARHDSTPQAPMSPSERSACSLLHQLVLQCSANSAASATLSLHGNHRHEREQRCRHAGDTCRLSGAVDWRRCASVARAGPRHRPASRSNILFILSYLLKTDLFKYLYIFQVFTLGFFGNARARTLQHP